jgi:hypothetical protein
VQGLSSSVVARQQQMVTRQCHAVTIADRTCFLEDLRAAADSLSCLPQAGKRYAATSEVGKAAAHAHLQNLFMHPTAAC